MTVNPYLNLYDNANHQDLWNSMVVQSIQWFGMDVSYLPRHLQNYDELLGADDASQFTNAYVVEMQIINTYGFEGDKDFYSKFGHQVRDQIVLSVNRTRWLESVGNEANLQQVPNEGDLIWISKYKKLFVIKYVDPREMFYQLGSLYTWELTCEVFEYSGEEINTGDPEIDSITLRSTNDVDWALTDEHGNILTDEQGNILTVDGFSTETVDPGSQNDYLPVELRNVANVDITIVDPFDFIQSQSGT